MKRRSGIKAKWFEFFPTRMIPHDSCCEDRIARELQIDVILQSNLLDPSSSACHIFFLNFYTCRLTTVFAAHRTRAIYTKRTVRRPE